MSEMVGRAKSMARITVRVHRNAHGEPITDSAICNECEGDAGRRIGSWKRAREDETYDGRSREDAPGLRCAFCGRLDRRKPVGATK